MCPEDTLKGERYVMAGKIITINIQKNGNLGQANELHVSLYILSQLKMIWLPVPDICSFHAYGGRFLVSYRTSDVTL